MRRLTTWLILIFFGTACLGVPLRAQKIDLVKLRKKEAERRKKIADKKKKGKIIRVDNGNLKKIASKSRPLGYVSTEKKDEKADAAAAKPLTLETRGAENAEIEESGGKRNAEYWQRLKRQIEERIAELEKRLRLDELRLNQLHSQYLTQDLPLQKRQIKEELDNLRSRHETDKERLNALNQELEDLHEKARRAGVPPGWLR